MRLSQVGIVDHVFADVRDRPLEDRLQALVLHRDQIAVRHTTLSTLLTRTLATFVTFYLKHLRLARCSRHDGQAAAQPPQRRPQYN